MNPIGLLTLRGLAQARRPRPAPANATHGPATWCSPCAATAGGAISVQVLQEFYVIAVTKIAVKLSPADARSRLRALSRWTVHSPLAADVLAASAIGEDNQISFWDAMIIRSASELTCGCVWTEALNDGQMIAGVQVRNPFR